MSTKGVSLYSNVSDSYSSFKVKKHSTSKEIFLKFVHIIANLFRSLFHFKPKEMKERKVTHKNMNAIVLERVRTKSNISEGSGIEHKENSQASSFKSESEGDRDNFISNMDLHNRNVEELERLAASDPLIKIFSKIGFGSVPVPIKVESVPIEVESVPIEVESVPIKVENEEGLPIIETPKPKERGLTPREKRRVSTYDVVEELKEVELVKEIKVEGLDLDCQKYALLLNCIEKVPNDLKVSEAARSYFETLESVLSAEDQHSEDAFKTVIDSLGALVHLASKLSVHEKQYVYTQCYSIYTKINLHRINLEFLKPFEKMKSKEGETDWCELCNQIKKHYQGIKENKGKRIFATLKAKTSGEYYPLKEANLPENKGSLKIGDRKVEILTSGSLTVQPKDKKNPETKLEPIFIGFLNHLKNLKQKILLISLQDNTTMSLDCSHNKAIFDAQSSEEFKECFTAIVLPKNKPLGNINWKRGEFVTKMRDYYIGSSKTGIFIPDEIKKDESFKTKLTAAIQGVSQILGYDQKDTIVSTVSTNEIRLAHRLMKTFIPLILVSSKDFNYINFSCREEADRAMGTLTEFFADIMIQEVKVKEDMRKILEETVFSLTYLAAKKVPVKKRVKELVVALNFRNQSNYKDLLMKAIKSFTEEQVTIEFSE